MTKHYTIEELELYRHGEMSILSRIQCKAHLNDCKHCQVLLEELKKDDLLVSELRSSVELFEKISNLNPDQKKNRICPLYGAIGGDMIGSCYEFHNLKSKEFPLFQENSCLTDDSVLTIATADALLHGTGYAEAYRKWGRQYPNAGYGAHFRSWLIGDDPQPYNSWGNGSAMRISPVGFFRNTEEDVLAEAERSASVTHNHPAGIKGAQAAALAVFLARIGSSKMEIKEEMESRFQYDLSSRMLDDIRPDYSFDVSCTGTLPVALLAFLESTDYEDAVRNAVSIGGDSDTIAAIAGGIAFAYYKTMARGTVQEIEKRLPRDMRAVCDEFNEAMNKGHVL